MKKRSGLFFFFVLIIIPFVNITHPAASDRGLKLTVKTPQGDSIDLYRDSYALIVGNSNYSNGWDPIPGAIQDVTEVATALEKHGFNITLKTDLSKNEFNRAINEFSLKYGNAEDNRLLFYFAGHGFTRKMATGEELGYLVMVDAPLPEKDLIGFSINSVDMQSLITQAKLIKARHVLFMFDSCFSGSIISMRERFVPKSISNNIKYPVRQFITAGRANEPVPDHSVFKQAFLDLIEGRDEEPIPDNYVTGEELGLYLKTKVPEYNPAQHPQYGKIRDPKLDKGDFVFELGIDKRVESKRPEKEKPRLAYIPATVKAPRISLRKKSLMIPTDGKLNNVLAEHGFFEITRNSLGSFDNHFVDNNDGTVTDEATGLMWQKSGSSKSLDNREAKKYIKRLNQEKFASYSDWRMPTIEELASLLEKSKEDGLHIDPVFSNKQIICWTADQSEPNRSHQLGAWVVNFKHGEITKAMWPKRNIEFQEGFHWDDKNKMNYLKAVRTIK